MPENRNRAIFQLLMILNYFPFASPAACVTAYVKYYSKSASGFYESHPSTTYAGCETFCSAKVYCKGFGYFIPTSTCHLSATNTPEPDTSSWTFSKKVCLDDLPTTVEITTLAATTYPTTAQLTTERETTFYLSTTTQQTTIITTEEEDTTTVPISGEITTTKISTSGQITTTESSTFGEITPTEISTSGEITIELSTSEEITTIELSTSGEITTTELSTSEEITTTELSTSGELKTTELSTSGEITTTKLLTSGEITTTELSTSGELTTTELSTSGEITTTELSTSGEITTAELSTSEEITTPETSTSTYVWTTEQSQKLETTTNENMTTRGLSFVSSHCTCVCKNINVSLSDRMAERKQELSLNVRELSAFTRKLTCAPDYRPSSTGIGYLGVLILVIWGLLFAFPDILRVVQTFRSRRMKRLIVRVRQQFIAFFCKRHNGHR